MNLKMFCFAILIFCFLCAGCNETSNGSDGESIQQPLPLSTQNSMSPYSLPIAAQEVMDDQKNKIVKYKALQTEKDLFIAIQVTSLNQMSEQDIEKKIQKKLKKKIPEKKVHVTSDQKFLIEIGKLQSKKITDQKKIEKKIKDMKKLLKDSA
ncbi:hypothetical protein F9U64_02925 [Gracilibacillus oryzae]|uniref:Sporulation protein n=1 Tax=Gracilibacillus oryzae TaxID=1672701 RepID=A0A7C8GW31_9BACI|nr:YhcN/YlaJ family sporulation lipoprotein [Gracilibacillus oryzae]KAB8138585.1 hypothetical protein F9U64_02925 [Gracilibacillus oryzae]